MGRGASGAGDEQKSGWREVFAVREFRALWVAELQSVAGDQLARIALSFLVYQRTGSAGLTAATYAISLLPDLVSGPLLAGLADRFPRRRVMVTCDLARAGLIALMLFPYLPLSVTAALLVLVQMFAAPFSAAQAATLPLALTGQKYVTGQALRQVTAQLAQLAGFAAGGTAVAFIGTTYALAIDAATFLLSAILVLSGVKPRPAPKPSPNEAARGHLGRLGAGARVIWSDRRLRSLVGLAWLAGFVVLPAGLAIPYASEIGEGPLTVGLLLAADPAGLIVGAVVIRWISPPRQQRLMAPFAVASFLPLLPFFAEPGTAVAVALLTLGGFCGAYQITASTTFMRSVPDANRGQAFGLAGSGLIAVQGLGVLAGGALTQATGSAGLVITLSGCVGLAIGATIAMGWHRHRQPNAVIAG